MINNSSNNICIIISYFGKLPDYFPVWKKSCEFNPKIDFFVFSDINMTNLPENIFWVKMSLSEMKELAEKNLEMEIKLDTPYECCDLKAVYGIIYRDFIQGYDYWGYCDMDMVFGDLSWWFDKYNLYKYDRFLSLGHLSMMRNTDENNQRYKLSCTPGKGYKDSFITPGSTHFCENEINKIYNSYSFPFFEERLCADLSPIYERLRINGYFQDYPHQVFFWQRGKTWRICQRWNKVGKFRKIEIEEFAYIHFQKRKMESPKFNVNTCNAFYICSHEFVEKKNIGYPTIDEIKRLNPYKGPFVEILEWIKYRIKN